MSKIESKTMRLNVEDYEEARKLSGKIYDTENVSQYTRDALREKNIRVNKKLNR